MRLLPPNSRAPSWKRERPSPALAERVVHVDLKGPKIPFKVLKQLLPLYARWGISGVLVEYEHRLPHLPLPRQFPQGDRYSRAEIADLVHLSHDLGLDYIPLVQTLGHVEYLRHIRGTAAMMENPAYPNQLCPSNPRTREYLTRLIEITCELHPKNPRINVGLDETQQLGFCPVCKKRAAALGGKMELYLEHARWITSLVLRHGRIPMMWGDMFLGKGRDDLIAKLDLRVHVMPWDYGCVTPRSPYLLYKGNRPCKAAFRHDYTCESYPSPVPMLPAKGGFAEDLKTSELRRLGGLDVKTGLARGFVQGRIMAKVPRPLWGTCAADASASGPFRPNFVRGLYNCNQMVREVLDLRGRGVVATVWARGHSFAPINSMWPVSLYTIAQFAASGWTGKTSPAEVRRRRDAIAAEVGMPARIGEWALDDLLWVLSNPPNLGSYGRFTTLQTILGLLRDAKVKGVFAEGLSLSIQVEILSQELHFLVEEARWWHPNRDIVPPSIGTEMRARVRRIVRDIAALKPVAKRYYTGWVGEGNAFETWWRGLFEVDIALARKGVALV